MNDESSRQNERRVHPRVREVFVQACTLLAPLVQNKSNSLPLSSYAMVLVVRDHFPDFSNSEIQVVINTVERLQRENRLQLLLSREQS